MTGFPIYFPKRRSERGNTAAALAALNEVLLVKEWCIETDTGRVKLGDGVTAWNSLPYFDGGFFTDASGADTITATFSSVPVLVDGLQVRLRAAAANTGPVTFNPNGLGALPVTKQGGIALIADDIHGAGHELVLRYVSSVPRWELLNPSASGLGASVDQYNLPQLFTLAVGRGNTLFWTITPGSSSPASQGFGFGSAPALVGTPTAGVLAGTDLFSQSARYVNVSATGAGSQVWYPVSVACACVRGGFLFAIRGAVADAATVANSRMFMGFRAAQTAPGNVEPDTLTDLIGIAAKAGDANLSIIHNDSSGTATMVSLGANFPAQTLSTDVYRLEVYCAPGGSIIYWRVLRENTGHVASGNFNTDLPTSTTLMSPQWWRNNGTTALAVKMAAMSVYCKWNLEG